jgi:hypothetical protein
VFRLLPAARHAEALEHETEFSCLPLGRATATDQVPPLSVVLREAAPPRVAIPTTTQVGPLPHETDDRDATEGWSNKLQVVPSLVPMIDGLLLI